VHRHRGPRPIFQQAAAEHGIHLRDEPPVVYKGGFYAQWQYGVPDPSKVSREALERILRNEIGPGIWELCCHPGRVDPRLTCVYHAERELELQTLTDPGLPAVLAELGIERIDYRQLPEAIRRLDGPVAPA
jgi:predicted glycoside hydrolase/deacetylase ChbG (UPF0249 family)